MYAPAKPKFYFMKLGCRGSKLHGRVGMMAVGDFKYDRSVLSS